MRIFQTQSMWDAKEGRWYEVFSVDGESCSGEEYFRELEVEQCLEDDEIDETSYCQCCECPDNEDCDDFECTCCKNEEIEENYIDNDLVIQCDCPDCVVMREEIEFDDDECDCLECRENRKIIFISEATKIIADGMCCPQCIYELLESVYDEGEEDGFDQGYDDAKEEMKDFLED